MGHSRLVQLLVDNGADIDAKDTTCNSQTPLEQALVLGSGDVVRLLVGLGAEVNHALAEAAFSGNLEMFRLLLELSDFSKAKGEAGRKLLWQASRRGHLNVVRLLLDAGADISSFGISEWTPLHEAAAGGHEGLVALLLECGAAIEAKPWQGKTSCQVAAAGGYKLVVQLLLDKKADLEAMIRRVKQRSSLRLVIMMETWFDYLWIMAPISITRTRQGGQLCIAHFLWGEKKNWCDCSSIKVWTRTQKATSTTTTVFDGLRREGGNCGVVIGKGS